MVHRIGMLVPSCNVTLEAELPALLRRQSGRRFSFHSARLRLPSASPQAPADIDHQAGEALAALADAGCDAVVDACPLPETAGRREQIDAAQQRLTGRAPAPLVCCTLALVQALRALGAARVNLITPYEPAVTQQLAGTLAGYGIAVLDQRSLAIAEPLRVAALDPLNLLELAATMDHEPADALVIAACPQMPSLSVLDAAERRFGLPVISALSASAYGLLRQLQITPSIDGAGRLLQRRR